MTIEELGTTLGVLASSSIKTERVTVQITDQDIDRGSDPVTIDQLPVHWNAEENSHGSFDIDLKLPEGWTHFQIIFDDIIVTGERP